MNYRELATTGLKISEISLGTWLTLGDSLTFSQSELIVKSAYNMGINFFDTAGSYAFGEAEIQLGKILKDLPREDFVVASKCYFPSVRSPKSPHTTGLSKKNIIESVNQSLRRLGVQYIDLYQCHRFDPNASLDDVLDTFSRLIDAGKILHWGVSQWPISAIQEIRRIAVQSRSSPICSQQNLYNLFHRDSEKNFDYYGSERISFLAYSPLARGVLTGKYLDGIPHGSRAAHPTHKETLYDLKPENQERVRRLKSLADELGVPLENLVIARYLCCPAVTSVILGASRPEHLKNLARELKLSQEVIDQIDVIFRPGEERERVL